MLVRTLIAITSTFLSTLYQQTTAYSLSYKFLPFFRQDEVISDSEPPDYTSCPDNYFPWISLPTTERTEFSRGGCTIYGYPSTGGVLIKEADLVDMLFLSLPRSHAVKRSPNADEEDEFCHRLRRAGATWWPSREAALRIEFSDGIIREKEEEEKVMVYGWPEDGVGVWVLRYEVPWEMPRDFGRLRLAMSMEERIEIMKEYNATFFEDITEVKELEDSRGAVDSSNDLSPSADGEGDGGGDAAATAS